MDRINIVLIKCVLQVALLGNVTPNLRVVDVEWENRSIKLYFFYEFQPNVEEQELSEVIATEVLSDFIDISVDVERIVVPMNKFIPLMGLRIYKRKEYLSDLVKEQLKTEKRSIAEIKCSLQSAILGQITPNLRLLTVDLNEKEITIYLTYEFAPSNDDNEASEIIARRVSADLNMPVILERSVVPMTKLFNRIGQWIYHRMEHIDESIKE